MSIKESIKRGWEIWKANKKVITFITLPVFLIGIIPNPVHDGIGLLFFKPLVLLISTFFGMGYLKTLLMVEEGKKVEFGEMFKHAKYFWRYLSAMLLYGIIIGVGFILFIIPGIYFALKYSQVFMLVLDKDMRIGEAFTRSGVMTNGVKWKLFRFYFLVTLIELLGLLALGVGELLSMPVAILSTVV
ncbi:hypothetical protein KW807_02720, partial [Candidatus Parcubacteria bacterium]|nr:hypothetical protein [Candidatus Parcubacteria bacterium]